MAEEAEWLRRWLADEIQRVLRSPHAPLGQSAQRVTDRVNEASEQMRPHTDPHQELFDLSDVQAMLDEMVAAGTVTSRRSVGRFSGEILQDDVLYALPA
jgi:hypothetical protein